MAVQTGPLSNPQLDPIQAHQQQTRKEHSIEQHSVRLYIAGVSEKLRMIFNRHCIPVHFKPSNTMRQKLIHSKDKTPSHEQNSVVMLCYTMQQEMHRVIQKKKKTLHQRMRDTSLDTVMFTFWTENTNGLKEESGNLSMSNWNNHHLMTPLTHLR